MAASFARSTITPVHPENNSKFSRSGPMAIVRVSRDGTCSKRRGSIALACVINGDDENAKSREVQRILDGFPSETLSKGSHSLPSKKISKSFFVIYLLFICLFLFIFCLVDGDTEESVERQRSFEWSVVYDT